MKKPTRWYSNKQEKQVAKAVKGKQTSNSGATAFQKGDVITTDWLIECKTSTSYKKSFSIKEDWIKKNKEEAFGTGKLYSALAFNFGPNTDNYYIIDEKMFKYLVKQLEVL
ncbi:hypothetical protein J6O48_08850 [bacterium]|nr:hypothetical protein [bacterium]